MCVDLGANFDGMKRLKLLRFDRDGLLGWLMVESGEKKANWFVNSS